ncbi:hypothetical protein M431DRAFT_453794 [Trichoderma harzianum CBS 226.95]|uniref:Uncharacterized protein n=1 Tax=Trichoderma harzianum CBS 226.95 TaxID=983964 RepID=A0A2T4AB16_TRIHA|nr:hypothetical protein M431DRAFT_453794 [Trichoderma harzianum CBS 226.95]PTB54267.1 hypothetical protein M431DRAFT_453794 [Trichoderma harzianum CBS 226.95]
MVGWLCCGALGNEELTLGNIVDVLGLLALSHIGGLLVVCLHRGDSLRVLRMLRRFASSAAVLLNEVLFDEGHLEGQRWDVHLDIASKPGHLVGR